MLLVALSALLVLRGASARAQALGTQIAAYGRVSPGERAVVIAVPTYQGAPQIIGSLAVVEGDHVAAGQKLAETSSKPLAQADISIAQAHRTAAEERLKALLAGPKVAEVATQEAIIESLKAETKSAKARKRPDTTAGKQEYTAHEEALDWKVISAQRQLDALREVRPADLAIAQAEVQEAAGAVAKAQGVAATTEVVAPMGGVILKLLTYPGESASRGLLELGAAAPVIKAELSVADAALVSVGAKATLKSSVWSGALEGTVTHIDGRVERSTLTAPSTFANVDRQVVEATIIPNLPEKLTARPGTEVTVLISIAKPAP